ncbi:T9SS type A sorting domain-containing protein [Formosa sp. PL04]|uniref:T9SS type A sorting domain-containing protein n=1 Tax=Formosa sp. PL04 TaxID=3081755 RepID=UPI002980A3DD|nr:T9SS type A sorting domain-containing protein [Formosa sp. PL04]MDW5287898.1 T9SS type A sorting domain-containing protein [Formosa sp. PL04]
MKKIYYLLLICLTVSALGYGQTTLRNQSFEGTGNWNFTPNPATAPAGTTWGNVTSLGSLLPTAGAHFRGLNNPTSNAGATTYQILLNSVDVSLYQNIFIVFDYMYETSGTLPQMAYRLTIDGVVGSYIGVPLSGSSGSATITPISVPDTATSVSMEIAFLYTYGFGSNPAATANIGIDNIKLYTTSPFTGLEYISDAVGWKDGNSPSNTTSAVDALIYAGTYSIAGDVALNSVYINEGAAINIENTGALAVASALSTFNQLTINSDSNQYGSLIVEGTVTGTATYKRHVNSQTNDDDLISAPVSGQTFGTFASANSSNLPVVSAANPNIKFFGPFDRTSGSYLTWSTASNAQFSTTLNPGIGYRTGSTDNGTFNFTGKVNTESISVDVFHKGDTPASQWNLIGNPYPSYVSLYDFLNYNTYTANGGVNIFQVSRGGLYGYNAGLVDWWTIYNMANTMGDTKILSPGQGFYVAIDDNLTGVMTFNPDMRIDGSGDDFIPGRADNYNKSNFTLSISADQLYHTNEVYFFDDIVSLGLDNGFDTAIYGNNASGYTLFTKLVESNPGYKMGIQSLPNSSLKDSGVTIALGVIAPKGQQITLDLMETTLPENVELYLEDTVDETWTLLTEKAYTFTTATALNGLGRFYLHAAENKSLSIEDNAIESLKFFTGNQSIKIKGQLDINTKLTVYDIQGRQMNTVILNKTVNEYTINANGYSSGIYIVKVENQTGNQITKRVILK